MNVFHNHENFFFIISKCKMLLKRCLINLYKFFDKFFNNMQILLNNKQRLIPKRTKNSIIMS